ncbi:MAG: hypothetical protein AVDCRST_MAG30-888 [uncultured Solirubrobacteraceae bacterium]|uniref:Uncharacterized protein n=1 Tax=uncultured Solirubrobacteraceae bacterium TaxID=1162706 RepID=A0A6J4S106_9ACTN|nr:MAG: hypothetical protein AVDCRST_MAG30-888 [uncultured Solirubrobacteraceae bacterium]
MPSTETLHRASGAIALTVGTSATVSPRLLLKPFGIARRDVTGAAEMGWRMFGIRTALIGGAVLAGHADARRAVLPVQFADQLVFAQAGRSGAVPARAANLARAVSGLLIVLGFAIRARS